MNYPDYNLIKDTIEEMTCQKHHKKVSVTLSGTTLSYTTPYCDEFNNGIKLGIEKSLERQTKNAISDIFKEF